jgi:hypothetical protein
VRDNFPLLERFCQAFCAILCTSQGKMTFAKKSPLAAIKLDQREHADFKISKGFLLA